MGELGGSAWLVLLIAGLWLAIAAALLVLAGRRIRDANSVVAAATSMASLLEVAPSRPVLVRPGGPIEADERLLRELSVEAPAKSWSDLSNAGNGLVEDDVSELRNAVQAAALSGAPIERQVRAAGSNRIFEVRGGPAPAPEPPGTIL